MMEIVSTIGICAWFVLLGMIIGIEIARRRDAHLIQNANELRATFRKLDLQQKIVGPGMQITAHLTATGDQGNRYTILIEKVTDPV